VLRAFGFLDLSRRAAAGREAGRERGKPAGAFERGARGERAPGEGCECGEGGIEPGEERDAVAGEACRRRQPGEFGDGLEVPGIIVVCPAEGSREFAAVADDEVADEGRTEVVGDEAERAGGMARRGDGADPGEDLLRRFDREGHGHRRGTAADERGRQPEGVAAADAGAKDEPAIAQAAVAGAGDDRGAGRGSNCGGGAGVVAVTMCEEDAFERAADGFEGAEDGGRAIGEAGIDEGDAAGGDGDDEDVGAAGAGQPPDAGQGLFGEGGGHAAIVPERAVSLVQMRRKGRRKGRRRRWWRFEGWAPGSRDGRRPGPARREQFAASEAAVLESGATSVCEPGANPGLSRNCDPPDRAVSQVASGVGV